MSRRGSQSRPDGRQRRVAASDGSRLTAGELYRRAQRGDLAESAASQTTPISISGTTAPGRSRPPVDLANKRRSPRPSGDRPARAPRRATALRLGRTAVLVCSVLTLAMTGLGWYGVNAFGSRFDFSDVLHGAPRSSDGAQNILLMGLDTRKDKNGNDLPPNLIRALHAGDGEEGGYNTNTLILVHIPADQKNIVAFSIPRDDLVSVSGLDVSQAKIKEVYGRTKAKVAQQLVDSGVTDQSTLEAQGREAGRAATVAAVRTLTGVPVDRFAEVSLVGFYDLAKALGGVQVCLNHAVSDSYSGAHFHAGRQQLNAAQSLAFVRQRHGLDNGDLDRTHRQQAFLLSATHQIESAGTLTDLTKLNRLMDVVDSDVVLSSGWDLVSWAREMSGVPDQHVTFQTLPVVRYDTVDGQDVNIINPTAIRAQVQRAFGLAPASSQRATPEHSAGDRTGGATAAGTTQPDTSQAGMPQPDSGAAVVSTDAGVPCVD